MKRKYLWIGVTSFEIFAVVTSLIVSGLLSDAFAEGPTEGPFTADGTCPEFRQTYAQCEVLFGNRGLSTLNSFYETFVGEGAFEINAFTVQSLPGGRYNIVADSNRGPIRSEIYTDREVRLGQDLENEIIYRTHQSAFCDGGRIYEHQVGYVDGELNVQDLEFWTEGDKLRFRLFQNGSPAADVVCQP